MNRGEKRKLEELNGYTLSLLNYDGSVAEQVIIECDSAAEAIDMIVDGWDSGGDFFDSVKYILAKDIVKLRAHNNEELYAELKRNKKGEEEYVRWPDYEALVRIAADITDVTAKEINEVISTSVKEESGVIELESRSLIKKRKIDTDELNPKEALKVWVEHQKKYCPLSDFD